MAYFEFSPGLNHATNQVVQDVIDLKTPGLAIDPAEPAEKPATPFPRGATMDAEMGDPVKRSYEY